MKHSLFIVMLLVFLAACSGGAKIAEATAISTQIPTVAAAISTQIPTVATGTLTPTDLPVSDQILTPTLIPDGWKSLPIVPTISPKMVAVYQRGLARGRDPNRFSKIGDCQNITTYFLAEFDNTNEYSLGSTYAYLQPTIDHFAGSWSRESLAVKGGLNVAAALNPMWANRETCNSGESPIACEIRVYNPSVAIISMEESWSGDIVKYDRYMRMIVEYVLSQDVVPILATRAEVPNPEISINATVTRIAYDYNLPLWNFWAASNPLPYHGLEVDGFHLTWAAPYFGDPQRMEKGWPWRNLTALQSIDAVWHGESAGH